MILEEVVGFPQNHIASTLGNQNIFTPKYTFNSLICNLVTILGPFPVVY